MTDTTRFTITAGLIVELVGSQAMDPALVCYDDDGRYRVRSTIRDASGQEPGNGYEIVATQQDLVDYVDDGYFDDMAENIAQAWQAREVERMDKVAIRKEEEEA